MNTIADFSEVNTIEDICQCPCHKEGMQVMHCVPCCNLTYQTYINTEDKVVLDKYKQQLKALRSNK